MTSLNSAQPVQIIQHVALGEGSMCPMTTPHLRHFLDLIIALRMTIQESESCSKKIFFKNHTGFLSTALWSGPRTSERKVAPGAVPSKQIHTHTINQKNLQQRK